MIANVSQSATFDALSYAMEKTDAETLFQNNLYGANAREIGEEMKSISDMRNFKKPVLHMSLSLDKDEKATDAQWKLAADAYMKKLGFDLEKAQFIAVRHKDTEHDHIHIIANLVQLDNSIVKDYRINERSHEAARAAELASGLKVFVKTEELKNEGKMHSLRLIIDQTVSMHKDYANFKSELSDAGISVIENRSKTTGYLSGISFKLESTGQTFKASSLGKEYGLSGLEKQGLETGRPQQIQVIKGQEQSQGNSKQLVGKMQRSSSQVPSAAGTQAKVDAEKGKANAHSNQAKSAASKEEAKRVQSLKQKEREDEEEEM